MQLAAGDPFRLAALAGAAGGRRRSEARRRPPLPRSTGYRRRPPRRATQNRIEDAIGLYRQAVKLRPSWAEGWWFLGELLYDQNQYPEARDALRRLIALDQQVGPGLRAAGPLRV